MKSLFILRRKGDLKSSVVKVKKRNEHSVRFVWWINPDEQRQFMNFKVYNILLQKTRFD